MSLMAFDDHLMQVGETIHENPASFTDTQAKVNYYRLLINVP